MAARNRPRGGASKEDPADAHEERNMWNQIMIDLKKLSVISAKAKDTSKAIVEKEASMGEGEQVVASLAFSVYPCGAATFHIHLLSLS